MNRNDFQELAQVRIEETQILLDQGKSDGAYYLAGYAVECALKACICKLAKEYDLPPKAKVINDYYSHVIEALVRVAGLSLRRDADAAADKELEGNWLTVKDWSEETRYVRKTHEEARDLIAAIIDADHGVLPWIQQRW